MRTWVALSLLIILASCWDPVHMNESCTRAGLFDTSNQTIIQTQHSLKQGALFLSVTEHVPSLSLCEQQCCDTPQCSLAVYRHNANKECYLFDCGTLHDFRCVFDMHADYSTMGMTIDRTQFDKLHTHSQHEIALEQLKVDPKPIVERKRYEGGGAYYGDADYDDYDAPAAPSRSRSRPQHPIRYAQAATKSPNRPKYINNQKSFSRSRGGCKRNQWQCEGGGCIAVYDRCDRIPQCADGSDENEQLCRQWEADKRHRQRESDQPRNRLRKPPGDAPPNAITVPTPDRQEKNKVISANNTLDKDRSVISIHEDNQSTSTSFTFQTIKNGTSMAAVTLGLALCLLALFLVFVSCRLRNVRRRSNNRRPGRAFETDENETLMNGLYL